MKTPAQRQKALRDRRKEEGLSLVRFWATKKQAKELRKFFADINRPKEKK